MTPESYQQARKSILERIEELRMLVEDLRIREAAFFTQLPRETSQRFLHLDREITRLRQSSLTVAFVGGFSAGKSSLVNAFLGRYLLPESPEITTAVPTFIRSTDGEERAELSYLGAAEISALEDMYRKELAATFKMPNLENAPARDLLEQVKPLTSEGRGKMLVEYFERFQEMHRSREIPDRGRIITCSLDDMQKKVRDEAEAMFLDRVEVHVNAPGLPSDVQLVDLPGVSVPNPRHRKLTFRFVTQDAHAVIFVLLATRLFDRDELDILERIRAGESSISQRTFWILNRWDALTDSTQQQEATISQFRAKMEEFAIPDDYVLLKTNALHGLLSQLSMRGEDVTDSKLAEHLKDYTDCLSRKYGDSHQKALGDSQIPDLQNRVLDYLNNHLRRTTLTAAVSNVEENLCQPLLHHLRQSKQEDDDLIRNELDHEQQERSRRLAEERFDLRINSLKVCFRELRDEVAVKRANMFQDEAKHLVEILEEEIDSGSTTDAYDLYKRIIADSKLRSYPYYFEIEMRVVDGLNALLKQRFREIVREQVSSESDKLTKKVRDTLEVFNEDVGYDSSVEEAIKDVLKGSREAFLNQVDGVVKQKACLLDELLVYKPSSGFLGFFTSNNEIIDGLEKAAKMHALNMRNVQQVIEREDMEEKTKQIRKTLKSHYVNQAAKFRAEVASSVWNIVIDEMQELEEKLAVRLGGKYRTLLELAMQNEVAEEYKEKRVQLESRAKCFRNAIEQLQDASHDMHSLLQDSTAPVEQ